MTTTTLTSTTLIVMLAVILVVFVLLLDFSLARFYHILQEATLLIAQLIYIPARTNVIFDAGAFCNPQTNPDYSPPKISPTMCTTAAILLHYLFAVYFLSLFLESLHNYTLYTLVLVRKPMLTRTLVLVVSLGCPLVLVGPTAALFSGTYTNARTCWLAWDSVNVYFELVPFTILTVLTVIVSESTGMNEHLVREVPGVDNDGVRVSALANSKASVIIPLVSLAAWLIGVLAVDKVDITLYTFVSVLNVVLGSLILFFHSVGSKRARDLLKKLCVCLCFKNK